MRVVCSSQEQIDARLIELGFTKDGVNFYPSKNPLSNNYLTVDVNATTGAVDFSYTGSDGSKRTIYTAAQSRRYCMIEDFELVDGGLALRLSFGADSSVTPDAALHYAEVAKEDGSGYVYFAARPGSSSPFILYDDLSEVVSTPSYTPNTGAFGTTITNTSDIVMICKPYNNRDAFIDAHARSVLVTQPSTVYQLYTFVCGGKKYLCGLYGASTSNIKGGYIALEVE